MTLATCEGGGIMTGNDLPALLDLVDILWLGDARPGPDDPTGADQELSAADVWR